MADEVFDIGDVVVLTHTITVDGVLTDPDTLEVTTQSPSIVETTAAWDGGAGAVTRLSVGQFMYAFPPTESGRWRWRWDATGVAQEAEEGSFRVRRRRVGV